MLEAIPEAHLDLAGDGDHRAALEAEVERRALAERVTFHGHVDEEEKARLLARAWVALTASSAEGWCLTVFEAAACGTPTAAMRVGGLGEAIVDGQTGLLADEPAELVAAVRDLVDRPEQRAALGQAALARARGYTWDATAQGTLDGHGRRDGGRALRAAGERSRARTPARPRGSRPPRWATTRSSSSSPSSSRACSARRTTARWPRSSRPS